MAEEIVNNNNNWQVKMRTLNDCGIFLFNNITMSDIIFVFKKNDDNDDDDDENNKTIRIYAHSWILSMLSPVFYENFKSNFEVSKQIPISFVLYESFLEFLRYIYTSKCTLTINNVYDTMKIAKKYSLKLLENDCANFIFNSITIESAAHFLDLSFTSGQTVLDDELILFIAPNITSIIKTKSFMNSEKQTLEKILSLNEIEPIREIEIFKAVMKWAEQKCIKNQKNVNGENKRSILGDLIKQIRFSKMIESELIKCCKDEKGILSSEEMQELLTSTCTADINKHGFRNYERKFLIDLNNIEKRCISTSDSNRNWKFFKNISDRKETSKFRVNKMLYITGIYPAISKLSQNVNIKLFNQQNIILYRNTIESNARSDSFVITPILLQTNRDYFINIKFDNINSEFLCVPQQNLPVTRTKDEIVFYFSELSQLLHLIHFKSID